MNRIKLILEFDLGLDDRPDDEISLAPEDWQEYFDQADLDRDRIRIIKIITKYED